MMVVSRLYLLAAGILLLIFSTTGVAWSNAPTGTAGAATDTVEVHDDFTYNPAGRRDPFAPLVYQIAKTPVKERRVLGPLEKFELNEFRLLAMMVVKNSSHAMVKAPDGKSYTVKLGDLMGPNGGVVARIETKVLEVDSVTGLRVEKSPDRIVVVETRVENYTGKTLKKEVYIEM